MATRRTVVAATKIKRRSAPYPLSARQEERIRGMDERVRRAAMIAVLRDAVDEFARPMANRTLKLDDLVRPLFANELLPGVTPEQCIGLQVDQGTSVKAIAAALGLPGVVIRDAIKQLAAGARIDWTPAPRKAVA